MKLKNELARWISWRGEGIPGRGQCRMKEHGFGVKIVLASDLKFTS